MTTDEIIRMAREAGATPYTNRHYPDRPTHTFTVEQLDALLAAEREACAKVCDDISEDQWALYKGRPPYTGQELERASEYTQGKSDGAEVCAAAIRARSNT